MIKLEMIKKTKYDYTFKDNNDKEYILNIIFINLDKEPDIGDIFYMSDNYIKETNIYNFGPLTNDDINVTSDDIIKIVSKNKEYYLQRYYG